MGKTKYLFFLYFLIKSISINAQVLEFVDSISYRFDIENKSLECDLYVYKICNRINENIYVWISPDSCQGISEDKIIHTYFFKRRGDFSLFDLYTEDLIYDTNIIIGYNFVKIVPQDDSFTFYIRKENWKEFKDRIVVIKESLIKKHLGTGFISTYKLPCLFIP